MKPHGLRIATLALALAAGGAVAQDVGFFRPAADPALTSTRPLPPSPAATPARPPQPTPPAPPTPAQETAQMAAAELANTRQRDAVRWAEQQMDHAEGEAVRSREQAQAPAAGVGAAFTGSASK